MNFMINIHCLTEVCALIFSLKTKDYLTIYCGLGGTEALNLSQCRSKRWYVKILDQNTFLCWTFWLTMLKDELLFFKAVAAPL